MQYLNFNQVGLISVLSAMTLLACSSAEKNSVETQNPQETHSQQSPDHDQDNDEIVITHTVMLEKRQQAKLVAETETSKRAAPIVFDRMLPVQEYSASRENYYAEQASGEYNVIQHPLSTFSVDVDTGSYSNVRRMLNQGVLPPADAVRVEEFINYFNYQLAEPTSTQPFAVTSEISPSPWQQGRHLMKISLQAQKISQDQVDRPRNLVFLLDVSGSMNQANKLPLVQRALTMLSKQLTERDSISIAVYAGASGVVLEPTDGDQTLKIEQALETLSAGGSTNGGQGIELAYQLAEQGFKPEGINRVILATDGDFNVGMVNHDALISLIESKRNKGIALTTLGFGQGNYNDYLMEQLADHGNGNYAYIDTIHEARKVLVEQLSSTLDTLASDVKIQVEFNPEIVSEYRLIGYNNRILKDEDFNNDKVDAGEIGQGHSVTAFYELILINSDNPFVAPLRYQKQATKAQSSARLDELAHIKLRYKPRGSDSSQLMPHLVTSQQITPFNQQNQDFKFATAVFSFAQMLKKSQYTEGMNYAAILQLAEANKGKDHFGYRSEFVSLIRTVDMLTQSAIDSTNSLVTKPIFEVAIEPDV